MLESPRYTTVVGIDIAAKTFTATWFPHGPQRPHTFMQTTAGYQALVGQLATLAADPATVLVGMEATGSYWVALAVFLHQAGYRVAVINPAQIASFATSLPRRAKTDLRDADLVCHFARERTPAPWTPPPSVYHELRQRLVARDALMEMRQQAHNQQHALAQWPIQVAAVTIQFAAVISDLDGRIAQLEREIRQTLDDGAWAASVVLLSSIPGLGLTTIAWLLVATVNFTLCASAEAVAAYAGLAPLAHESGTSVRSRAHLSRSGHARLRKALYMATLSATRHNPLIRPFYQRLREAGKPFKVAQCAAARKLLTLAWAVVTKQRAFDPTQFHPAAGQASGN
jgi:transposase